MNINRSLLRELKDQLDAWIKARLWAQVVAPDPRPSWLAMFSAPTWVLRPD